jgi:quercetin dioxygenase-like cupin family protein
MSGQGLEPVRITFVAPGHGEGYWVYRDKDTIKTDTDMTGGTHALVETTVSPNVGPPAHVHSNESETIYIIEGELKILDNDRTFTAPQGSTLYFPKGSVHAFRNVGTTTAKILLLFVPSGFEGYFREVGERVVAGKGPSGDTPEDLVARLAPTYGMNVVDVGSLWD